MTDKWEAESEIWLSLCLCLCFSVIVHTQNVYLFHSDSVDKHPSAVHTSPAAKTFSKSAAAPRNGSVNPPPAFKGPAAQSKPSYQPGGPSGRGSQRSPPAHVTHCLTVVVFVLLPGVKYLFVQLLLSVCRGQSCSFEPPRLSRQIYLQV